VDRGRPGQGARGPDRRHPLSYLSLSRGEIVAPYLKDADPACRAAAAAALLNVPSKGDAAVEALIPLAEAKDGDARERALWALLNHRPPSGKAAAVYLRGLKHPTFDYRLAAVQPVLAVAPDKAEEVLPVLEEGLKNTSYQVRVQTYALVPGLKGKGEKLAALLLARLKDPGLGGEAYHVLLALAPQAGRVGREVGEAVFADPKTANRFLLPPLRPFVPHFTDTLLKHLEGEDADRRKLAVLVARWAPPGSAGKLIPRLAPLLKDEALADAVLTALEAQGKEARAAAPEVLALLEGKPAPNRVATIRRMLPRLEPEPKALDGLLDRLKGKAEPSPQERMLAAELALLNPERRQEAAGFLEPLVEAKDFTSSYGLLRLLERMGPDAAGSCPSFRSGSRKIPRPSSASTACCPSWGRRPARSSRPCSPTPRRKSTTPNCCGPRWWSPPSSPTSAASSRSGSANCSSSASRSTPPATS
jgi:hypothetical protein